MVSFHNPRSIAKHPTARSKEAMAGAGDRKGLSKQPRQVSHNNLLPAQQDTFPLLSALSSSCDFKVVPKTIAWIIFSGREILISQGDMFSLLSLLSRYWGFHLRPSLLLINLLGFFACQSQYHLPPLLSLPPSPTSHAILSSERLRPPLRSQL